MGQLGEFEQVILFSVLRLGDEAYGVAIRDVIKDQTGRTVSSGAIYTTLGRLEERGLVASHLASPARPDGAPPEVLRTQRFRGEGPDGCVLHDAETRRGAASDSVRPGRGLGCQSRIGAGHRRP